MSTIRDRLKTMFTRNVIIKHLPGGRLKTYDVRKSQSVGSPTTYSNRSRWRSGRTGGYGPGFGGTTNNEEIEALRRMLYVDYELMDTDAIISSALDLIAEESTTVDIDGQLLKIKTDDERIKKLLHNLFYDVLNIEFNMWSWIRTMCKYGDHFLYLQIDENFGVTNVMPIHPSLMRREEGFDKDNPDLVRFKYEGDGSGYWSTQERMESYEVAHFRLLTDTNYLPYGRSFIEPAKKSYKMLSLLEDAVLLHRIMRAPERRIIKIDIGNIAPEEIDAHVEQVVQEMKKTPYIDPQTGEYNLRYNLENSIEDVIIPVRGGQSGNSVDVLPGLQNQNAMDDVEYIRKKMMAAIKIPKEFLGYGEDSGGSSKAGLASLDIRFARTVERVQKIFVSELYKIAIVHLYTQGFRDDDLLGFEIYLTNPSLVFERQKTDIMTAKVDLAKSIKEDNVFSNKYVYENIFGMSEDEWKADRDRKVEDAKLTFRLKQITEEGNDPNVSGKSFGTPWDIASLQVSGRMMPGTQEDMEKLYTPDGREDNEGKPPQYKGNFETKRDQDFGRDPVGRRENDKMETPSASAAIKDSYERFIKRLDTTFKKDTKKSLLEAPEAKDSLSMLNEDNILDDSTN